MTQIANDNLPKLVSAEILIQSADPLVGELALTTDSGEIVLALNKEAATVLLERLVSFLEAN
jgi:hypothetical protein